MAKHDHDHHDDLGGGGRPGLDRELDRGLAYDLGTLARRVSRRELLTWIGGAGLLAVVAGCDAADGAGPDAGVDLDDGTGGGACTTIPEETAGPYPGDGSNGPNALAQSGIVRRDIRSSFGGATALAEGVPLTVTLRLVDASGGCAPLAGYAIYLWHCDREGRYSMYSAGVTDQNFLRGVQLTDAAGEVTFTTIFPGCYPGRWPHIHFEIFPSQEAAVSGGRAIRTSQLAFPEEACDDAYTAAGYASSVTNLARLTLATDNVFSDGVSAQLAAVTGGTTEGYVATLEVGVARQP